MNFQAFKLANVSTKGRAYKAVLKQLAYYDMKGAGEVWPSILTLSIETGFSERAVRAALREIQKDKVIKPKGATRGGRAKSTHYVFTLNPAVTAPFEDGNPAKKELKGAKTAAKPGSDCPRSSKEVIKKERKAKPQKHPLCFGFRPKEHNKEPAKQAGKNLDLIFGKFQDYYLSDTDTLLTDKQWDIRLSRWIERERATKGDKPSTPQEVSWQYSLGPETLLADRLGIPINGLSRQEARRRIGKEFDVIAVKDKEWTDGIIKMYPSIREWERGIATDSGTVTETSKERS